MCRPTSALLAAVVLTATALNAQSPDGMAAAFAEAKAAVAENRLQTTQALGSWGHDPFRETASRPGVLIGLDLSLGKAGKSEVIYAVRAAYATATGTRLEPDHGLFAFHTSNGKKSRATRVVPVRAKPGYAVAGLTGRAGFSLHGLALTFQRVKDGKLDPQDSYQGSWVGDRSSGWGDFTCDSKGMLVVGIHGKMEGLECLSLGLVHVAVPKKEAPAPAVTTRPRPKPAPAAVKRREVKPAAPQPIPEPPALPVLPDFEAPPPGPAALPAVASAAPQESALAGWMVPVGVGLMVTVLGVGGVLLFNQPREQITEDVPPLKPMRDHERTHADAVDAVIAVEELPELTEEITEPDSRFTALDPTPPARPPERPVDGIGNLEL